MQIIIEPYNPGWPAQFAQIKDALAAILSGFNPPTCLEHPSYCLRKEDWEKHFEKQ